MNAHDLDLAALTRLPADAAPPRLPVSDVSYVVEDTAIGRMLLAVRPDGALLASAFTPDTAAEDAWLVRLARQISPRVLRAPKATDDARRELAAYLEGQVRDWHTPVDLALLTDFQRTVLTTLAEHVGYGERSTYAALAAEVERPRAARAVGAALGANPLCVRLPCHRVLASSGALTGYAGGLEAKRYLLDLEARG
ncbi:MAG: methylated-DNA--[protein]-cysteine S-methyltransferase [Micrococcales bacterium]|nr:methylated-DNA--[protein]-cysteine S-methyltransferase [Micrococcales bacterium]